jgi:hypothetical protein
MASIIKGGANECKNDFCFTKAEDNQSLKTGFTKLKEESKNAIFIVIFRYYTENTNLTHYKNYNVTEKGVVTGLSHFENIIGIYDKIADSIYPYPERIVLKNPYTNGQFDDINEVKKFDKPDGIYLNRIDKNEFYVIKINDDDLQYNILEMFNNKEAEPTVHTVEGTHVSEESKEEEPTVHTESVSVQVGENNNKKEEQTRQTVEGEAYYSPSVLLNQEREDKQNGEVNVSGKGSEKGSVNGSEKGSVTETKGGAANNITFDTTTGNLILQYDFVLMENLIEKGVNGSYIDKRLQKYTNDGTNNVFKSSNVPEIMPNDNKSNPYQRNQLNINTFFENYITENTDVKQEIINEIKPLMIQKFINQVNVAFDKLKTESHEQIKQQEDKVKLVEEGNTDNIKAKYDYIKRKLSSYSIPLKLANPTYRPFIDKLIKKYSKDFALDTDPTIKEFLKSCKGLDFNDENFKVERIQRLSSLTNFVKTADTKPVKNTSYYIPVGKMSSVYLNKANPSVTVLVFLTPEGQFSIFGKKVYSNVERKALLRSTTPDKVTMFENAVQTATSYKIENNTITPITVNPMESYDYKNFQFDEKTLTFTAVKNALFNVNSGGRSTRRKRKSSSKLSRRRYRR